MFFSFSTDIAISSEKLRELIKCEVENRRKKVGKFPPAKLAQHIKKISVRESGENWKKAFSSVEHSFFSRDKDHSTE